MVLLSDDRQRLQRLLPGHVIPTTSLHQDQLQAFTQAVEEGDLDSLKQLEQSFRTANLTTSSASSSFPPSTQPPSQLMTLKACDQDIEIMERTEGLREVLEQVQSGLVRRLQVKYGPSLSPPKKADPLWSTLGQQISKQEHLHRDFEVEFGGDMERYLTFFTYQGGVTQKVELKTRLMQLLVEDIPKHNRCLDLEAWLVKYIDNEGNFSKELWEVKWGSQNKWEIWFELDSTAHNWK